jgi:hypothetical protein
MNLDFESNYRDKILYMSFKEPVSINSKADVLKWRALWTDALKSWHSPYKALIDLSNVEKVEDSEEVRDALSNMIRFFKGFFLRKAAGYGKEFGELLPFDSFSSEEEASKSIGIRERKAVKPGDFRSAIQFENHFQQHVIELSFTDEVEITTSEQVITLKDKLTNNLMQWHSGWNLLVDCSSVKKIDESLQKDFDRIFKFFSGFFMKQVIGYAPSSAGNWHPFKVYRSRHKAAAALESEGFTSGSDANCSTREQ